MNFTLSLYTDGSCLGNPGPGGWAAIVRDGKKEKILVGHETLTTNNRMEMMAITRGLEWIKSHHGLKHQIDIFSDSRLLIHSIQQGWKRKSNVDLWQELDDAREGLKCTWNWVKGHAGHEFNERCDQLAVAEALKAKKEAAKVRLENHPKAPSQASRGQNLFHCTQCGKTSEGRLGYLKEANLIRVDCLHCGKYIKFASPTPKILTRAKKRMLMTSEQLEKLVQKLKNQGQIVPEKQTKKLKAMTLREAEAFFKIQSNFF